MFGRRMLARLSVLALGAMTFQPLVAGEPESSPPPAQSIREWMSPKPTPIASAAAAPESAGTSTPARSIRDWKTTPSPTLGPCPTSTPIAPLPATAASSSPVKPAAGAGAATSPVTISITSTLRQGNLVVVLDDHPIFNEPFQKPLLFISQTTKWDPIQITAGTHRLTAKVYGTKKTYVSKTYDLQLSRTKGAALHFVMQGDTLTVALAS